MSEGALRKGVDLASVVAFGLGTAVGVAIFSVFAPATRLAGPAMLVSVAIAAIPMFIIAATYAFMGSAMPISGASYEWPRRFLHPGVGFMVAWVRIAGQVSALVVLALVLVRYLSMAAALPVKPAMFGLFAIVFALNFLGVTIAASTQKALIAALVLVLLIFAGLGAPHIEPAAFTPFAPHGWTGVLAALPLLIGLFFGIEAATEIGEEVRDERGAIPLGIALSLASAVLLCLLVAAVSLGVLGPERLARSEAPLLEAAETFMGPLAKPLIVVAALGAIGTSLNAVFLVFSRTLFAMGRAGALPPALGAIHSRFGTPHIALSVAFACCVLGLLLPMNLTTLFLAISIPTLLKYASTCCSAAMVAARHPDVYAAARFKLSRPLTLAWALLGAAAAVLVAALGWSADWRPYAALGVWALLGAAVYAGKARLAPARA